MALGKKNRKRRKAKSSRPNLRVEALEQKVLLTTADIDVVRTGNDLTVVGMGDGGADIITLRSSLMSGNVEVEIMVDEEVGGKFDGTPDFTILQTVNVPTLEGQSAQLGGQFLGFRMDGKGGNDVIDASDLRNLEDTLLIGGDGNDTLIGGKKTRDQYLGGAGDDLVTNVDYLDTTNDPVLIDGGSGMNTLEFAPDSANGVTYTNTTFSMIRGTEKADNIDSSGFVPFKVDKDGKPTNEGVTVEGLGGNDTLIGSVGHDTLDGGSGNDTLSGLDGDDTLNGGDGKDTLKGGSGKDSLSGGSGDDSLDGGDGDDTLNGGSDNDRLDGGAGKDKLFGEGGNDTLIGGPGDDTIDGGDGTDTVDYSGSPGSVDVNLDKGKADNDGYGNKDTIANVENVTGSASDDKITGDGGDNTLKGSGGNDTIKGLGGNDNIEGGGGDDALEGGAGNDKIDGGAGNDSILGQSGDDNIKGGDGDDTINGDEKSEGSTGNDTIDGGGGNDDITGWNGDDVIMGGDGDDNLRGGFGNDMISGDKGSDVLDGGRGADFLEGGFNEFATDKLFFEYDQSGSEIADVVAVGGFAFRDEFVALVDFDDLGEETKDSKGNTVQVVNSGDGVAGGGSVSLAQRLDIRDELLFGGPNLILTDYDGGDGTNGDVLSFLDSQLP